MLECQGPLRIRFAESPATIREAFHPTASLEVDQRDVERPSGCAARRHPQAVGMFLEVIKAPVSAVRQGSQEEFPHIGSRRCFN